DPLARLGLVRGQAAPGGRLHPFQVNAAGLGGEAFAALLGPPVLGRPGHPVAGAVQGELEHDQGLRGRVGEVGPEPVLAGLVPGQPAVERERDRVQDRALARPGGPFEQEQAAGGQPAEVDPLPSGVGAERPQLEGVQPHQAAASPCWAASTACRSTASWASSGGAPATKSTNSPQISTGSTASASRARSASGPVSPPSGWNSRAMTCGHFSRSRSIGAMGLAWSVSTALTQAPARASRSSRRPRTSRSGLGTGVRSSSVTTAPSPPISASVTDLGWSFSEKEKASGDPAYLAVVAPPVSTRCGPCRWPRAR